MVHTFTGTQRVVVIGTTGSGKTTCAHQLAQKLAIPHVELDALFWDDPEYAHVRFVRLRSPRATREWLLVQSFV